MAAGPFEADLAAPFGVAARGGGGNKIGDIVFSQSSPGSLWLPADGRTISKAANPALHAALPLGAPAPTKLPTTNESVQMRSVKYFAGQYILQGISSIYKSSDLVSFTNIGNPLGSQNRTILGAAGFMVIAGGTAAYNTTATNSWQTSTIASGDVNYVGAFGMGLFVTVGQNYGPRWNTEGTTLWTACTSDDGLIGTSGFTAGLVEFVNGRFVIGNQSGYLYTSTDGKSFTRVVGANNRIFNRIFYSNGVYYGNAYNSGYIQKSADLISWVDIYYTQSDLCYNPAFDGTIFVSVSVQSSQAPRFLISYNMIDFTSIPVLPATPNVVMNGADFANGRVFLIANDAANVVFSGAIPGANDDKALPAIRMRTPAWIKAA